MSLSTPSEKHQKMLQIAEALLRKVDMPQATLSKYEELKQRILEEDEQENMGFEVQNQITSHLKDEQVRIYSDFLMTFTGFLSQVVVNGSTEGVFEESISPFVEQFEFKKKEMRDMALEANCSVQQRLLIKE